MTEEPTIIKVLASFIARPDVPLRAIAMAGEMIALDARLMDYDGILANRKTLRQISQGLETYHSLALQTEAIVQQFSGTQDGEQLIRDLSEIKQGLARLFQKEG